MSDKGSILLNDKLHEADYALEIWSTKMLMKAGMVTESLWGEMEHSKKLKAGKYLNTMIYKEEIF